MRQLLHTPEGVRDIYNVECGKKMKLERRILKTFRLFGYHDIQTPMFEYFDVFRKEIGTIPSAELYKFFDKDGNTLVLRPDITPSIARAASTLYGAEECPIRLCYTGNTFINHSKYKGRLREVTQMGVELIGDSTAEADAEVLALVIESLLRIGLKEFQICIGNVSYIESLIREAGLGEEEKEQVLHLINNHNFYGIDDDLSKTDIREEVRASFTGLRRLVGGFEILERAKENACNEEGRAAVIRLEKIYEILKLYGVEEYVSFDLSMTGTYGYYTGIIFRGYTYGTGDAIVKGGRYDQLLEKFGKDSPSIGFAIVLDELMNAMNRQHVRIAYERKNHIILYDESRYTDAVLLAKEHRNNMKNTDLLRRDPEKSPEEYKSYAQKYYAKELLYLTASGDDLQIDISKQQD